MKQPGVHQDNTMLSLKSLFGDDAVILRETNVQVLLVAAVIPPFGTLMVSPILDSLIDPFGASAASIGLLISAFTAPGIVLIPVVGVLADRYGRKPTLVSALVLFGLGGLAITLTTDFRLVLALRFVQGVGFAGTIPIIVTTLGDLYTGSREATGQGLRITVSSLSGVVFPLIAGVLVVAAWQFPFLLYGLALPAAGAVLLWADEPRAASAKPGTTASSDGGTSASYRRALLHLISHRRVFSMMVARAFPLVGMMGFLTYNSVVVVQRVGGTPPQAGLLVTVLMFVVAVAGSQSGRLTNWLESRFLLLVGANVCLGVGYAVPFFAPRLAVAGAGVAAAGIGFGLTGALYRSILTDLAPEALRGGLISIAAATAKLAQTLTPIAMGAAVAVATPAVGFVTAVQFTGLATALVAGGSGILCLVAARTAPPLPAEVSAIGAGD